MDKNMYFRRLIKSEQGSKPLQANATIQNIMIFKNNKPIYQQIADKICDEILSREYRDESRIPSVREHAATLDVNVNTIVRAYEHLLELDIIYTRRGLGYFVKPGAMYKVQSLRKAQFLGEELPEFLARLTQLDIPIEEIVDIYKSMK